MSNKECKILEQLKEMNSYYHQESRQGIQQSNNSE